MVGVAISFATNGGLIGKAKEAAKQQQIEADREMLLGDIAVSMGLDGKVDFQMFKTLATADGFTVSGTGFPTTATSKSGNSFTVTEDGTITYIGGNENTSNEGSDLALLRKYFICSFL